MSASLRATFCTQCGQELTESALFCPACGTPKNQGADADPLIGQILGQRFLVIERTGHGASGTIYRGEHTTLRRKVAIKVLHHELCRDDLAVERFRREAITVSEIDNDHIVEIHDFGRTPDERLYLVMELLEGETLRDAIERDKRLPVDKVIDILIQLGETLTEAHAMGYVHRDLRPRNVYLAVRRGRANFVKLLDFGLAKLVENEGNAATTSLGMNFGDPRYMSPEQARGDTIDRRADIYSLGCIAYEMLIGHAPFARGKAFDILAKHVDSMPPEPRALRDDVPVWLNTTIMQMLAKRPDERFITVFRLVEALRQGSQTGQAMSAEVARRRETVQPPMTALHQGQQTGSSQEPEVPTARAEAPVKRSDSSANTSSGKKKKKKPLAHTLVGARAHPGVESTADRTKANGSDKPAAVDTGRDASPASPASQSAQTQPGMQPAPSTASSPVSTQTAPTPPEATSRESKIDRSNNDQNRDTTTRATSAQSRIDRASRSSGGRSKARQSEITAAKLAARADVGPENSAAGLSGAWFADGDLEDGEQLDERQDERLAAARDNVARDLDASYGDIYVDDGRRRLMIVGGIIGGLVLLIIVVALAWPSGSTSDDEQQAQNTQPTPTAANVLAEISQPDAGPPSVDAAGIDALAVKSPDNGKRTSTSTESTKKKPSKRDSTSKSPDSTKRSSEAIKRATFFAQVGQTLLRNGNLAGAADNFDKALDLNPRNGNAVMGRGEIALRQGSYSNAIRYLTKATRLNKRNALPYTLLGEAYLKSGKPEKAADNFKRALRIDPDNKRARDGFIEADAKIPPPPEDEI